MGEPSRLATCSYSEFKASMGTSVRISLGGPRWWSSPPEASIWALTPRSSYLRGTTDDEYIAAYTQQLARHGVDRIEEEFQKIRNAHGGRPLVLMCFENLGKWKGGARGGDWCHRSLFAWWWMEQTGELIPELGAVAPGTPFVGDEATDTPTEVPGQEDNTLF